MTSFNHSSLECLLTPAMCPKTQDLADKGKKKKRGRKQEEEEEGGDEEEEVLLIECTA